MLEDFRYFTDTFELHDDCRLREMSNNFSQAITILSPMVCVFCHSIISHFSLNIGSISSLVQPGIIHTSTPPPIVAPHSHPSMPRPVLPTPISTHFSSLSRSRHPYFPILVVLLINLLPIHEIFQSNRGPIQVIANIPSPTSIMPKLIVLSVARFKASRASRAPFGGLAGGRLLSPMKYC